MKCTANFWSLGKPSPFNIAILSTTGALVVVTVMGLSHNLWPIRYPSHPLSVPSIPTQTPYSSKSPLGRGSNNQNGNLRWIFPLGVAPPLMDIISRHFFTPLFLQLNPTYMKRILPLPFMVNVILNFIFWPFFKKTHLILIESFICRCIKVSCKNYIITFGGPERTPPYNIVIIWIVVEVPPMTVD